MNVYPEWLPHQAPENATPQQVANAMLLNALSSMNAHKVILAFNAGADMSLKETRVTPGLSALHVLAMFGSAIAAPVIEAICGRGFAVNEVSGEGWTALHYAANRSVDSPSSELILSTLLKLGADPEFKSQTGLSPLNLGLGDKLSTLVDALAGTRKQGMRMS